MTARQIASLFLKLVACYVLIGAIPRFLATAQTVVELHRSDFPVAIPIAIAVGSIIGVLVLMYLIISRSDWFAARIVRDNDQPIPVLALTTREIQAVAFSWIGLLLMASSVSGLVYQLSTLRRMMYMEGVQSQIVEFGDRIYSAIAGDVSQLLLGAVLFLYPSGLSRLWHSIQSSRPMKS